jgi:hypothetical protein
MALNVPLVERIIQQLSTSPETGRPTGNRSRMSLEDRLWPRMMLTPAGCWEWQEIRVIAATGIAHWRIAAQFEVSRSHVNKIVKGISRRARLKELISATQAEQVTP